MAGQPNPTRVPSATDIARARGTDIAHVFQSRPANTAAIIDVQEGAGSQQRTRQLTWAQLRAEAQALNPKAKSPWKISTTITSPRAAS